ncbi:response regulator [Myxococcota bacterium]|nr:response regulator [Myxococcota bacterium]MBU1432342.1 response regulator [Myxococcota bacterium]MBU1898112.1 response regulator [Myxococcota bacterium]
MSVELRTDRLTGDILIVDDVPENLRLLMDMLTAAGHTVRPATGGKMALRSAFARPPDLILLDIRMPEMDGYEVCHQLQSDARTQATPVLFLSGLGETNDKVKGFAVGAVDYITKPFEVEEVLARVRTHVLLKQTLTRLAEQNEALEAAQAELEMRVALRTAALQASEAHHRAITRSAMDAIITLDQRARITSWNPAATRLFGWPEAEILGAPVTQLLPASMWPAVRDGARWLLKEGGFYGGQKRLELIILARGGIEVPVEMTLSRWFEGDSPYYIAILRV